MSYRAAKISFDGSHYIATPKENFPQGRKRRRVSLPPTPREVERKERFEAAYKESQKLPRKERKAYMRKAMEETIPDKEQRKEYVERNNERKTTNKIRRKVRLSKKVNLQREWNFFCTFTFSDKLHTEESFRKSLRNTFKHLVARKGWKHVGVWERAVKQTDCISTVFSTFRRAEWSERSWRPKITVPKTTGCRQHIKILTSLNGTGEMIFNRSARRKKYNTLWGI